MPKPVVRVKNNAGGKARRGPTPKPPNLPQHNLPEPYSRLLDLDLQEPDETFEKIAAELRASDANEAAQKLIALAQDDSFYAYAAQYPDFSEYMQREKRMLVPSQAVRLLTLLGDAAQAAIAPLLPALGSEDDFLREEMPIFYGEMGLPAMEPLAAALLDSETMPTIREGAGESLVEIAEKNAALREKAVTILEQALSNEKDDIELNAFLVGNLVDLGAKESYGIIEQAYEEDRVDEFIVALAEVQEHFGLPVTAAPPQWNEPLADDADDAAEALFGDLPEPPPFAPASEAPVEQPFVAGPKTGRNELCPCGSGKKYKKCHGA